MPPTQRRTSPKVPRQADRRADLRAQLRALDADRLVELLIDAAERDQALEDRLRLATAVHAARAGDGAPAGDAAAGLTAAVERAFVTTGHLGYWPALRHAQSAGEVAEALAGLVREGRATDARPLLERAIELLLATIGRADDSAGSLGDLMRRLLASHAQACAAAGADPAALARWLIDFQFNDPVRFPVDVAEYVAALEDTGLAAYRAAVHERWASDPADLAARHAAEGLARLDRDIDALVTIVGGDLRHAVQYGRLARALRDIGADAVAVQWAERGLRAHPGDPPGAGLRDFLVDVYLRRGGTPTAVDLRRDGLHALPARHTYAALRLAAMRAGSWPAERNLALNVLRERNRPDHVRALLYEEKDVDGAWSAAHGTADLDGVVWDDLARLRAVKHPADAIPVLRRRIEDVLRATGRDAYRDAARRLVELRELYERAERLDEFDGYLRELTERHRRRPSLLAELADAGLVAA